MHMVHSFRYSVNKFKTLALMLFLQKLRLIFLFSDKTHFRLYEWNSDEKRLCAEIPLPEWIFHEDKKLINIKIDS